MNEPRDLSNEDAARRPRRRWYQFRLRTIFVGMIVLGGVLVAYRAYVEPYRQQRQAMNRIKELGGTYQATAAETWQRWLFGGDYQNLTLVNLANCDKVDEYLPYLLMLPHLETLVVGGPAFGDDQLRQLNHVKTLKSLVLDSTSVSPEEAEHFWHNRLGRPDYATTVLDYSDQRAVTALAKLGVTVRVWSSGFASDDLKRQLGSKYFEKAIILDVKGTIDENVVEHLNRLYSIASIALTSAQAGDNDLMHLARLRHREHSPLHLSLKGTQVSDAGMAHLSALRSLHQLDLCNTNVGDQGLAHLSGLPDLYIVDLGGTKTTDAGLDHLISAPQLGILDLNATSVTDAGLDKLKKMKHLRVLELRETGVTAAGIRALGEALSDCSIFGVVKIDRKNK